MDGQRRILVLGVGNILYTDEGVGVRCVERLERDYEFTPNVTLLDGGTLGMRLMDALLNADTAIVVDAVLGGQTPGSIYRCTGDDLRKSLAFKDSMHQTDLVDTLIYCDLLGNRPECVVLGIEPHDYQTMAVELSPLLSERLDDLAAFALKEIEAAGGGFKPRQRLHAEA
ncbi:Hydrogenase 2 maturation protease [Fundidesulfovibrio magnetotacticus]|uniref:Hydrogenase 2 maturation protease n=1 Tax=Fundidesulfovibrio magnetotacticus TaxID=2730080 RepID=A0A6V8LRT9_9BACT|nr:HyaD/HybD family hydrogenase maturation endopeptidase [Fundidesulfovibrio magnetotacticus]GFK95192.1 Hydrogenase 2 maturation protease [Fundidesulfovibrio magnetotacticus]